MFGSIDSFRMFQFSFQLNIIDACVEILFSYFMLSGYACVREKCCLYGKQWLEQLHDSIDKPISKLKNEMRNTVPETRTRTRTKTNKLKTKWIGSTFVPKGSIYPQ